MGLYSSEDRRFRPEELEHLKQVLFLLMLEIEQQPVRNVTPKVLRYWHTRLSAGIADFDPGHYRETDITFGSFYGVAPAHIVQDLGQWYAEVQKRLTDINNMHEWGIYDLDTMHSEGLELALIAHAEIVRIHPFKDGNGRLSRIVLFNYCTLFGIETPVFQDRNAYFSALSAFILRRDSRPLLNLSLENFSQGDHR